MSEDVGDGGPGGRSARTTYLSELLAPVERLAEAPPDPGREPRLVALSWAFALVAAAALVVCGLLVYDVLRSGGLAAASAGARPVGCADAGRPGVLPCSAPAR